jgi:hypothetical protein
MNSFSAIWQLSDRAANLELCLVRAAFNSEVSVRATPTSTRDLRFKVISERPAILTSKCRTLGEEHSLPILTS